MKKKKKIEGNISALPITVDLCQDSGLKSLHVFYYRWINYSCSWWDPMTLLFANDLILIEETEMGQF